MGDFTKNAGLIATIAVPVCLVYSVAFDWGYYHAIGITFSELPSTISDHVRTALLWAPPFFVLMMFGQLLMVYDLKSLEKSRNSEISSKDKEVGFIDHKKLEKIIKILFLYIFPSTVILFLLLWEIKIGLVFLSFLFVFEYVYFRVLWPMFEKYFKLSFGVTLNIHNIVLLVMLVVLMGYAHAVYDVKSNYKSYIVFYNDGQCGNYNILRSLQSHLILYDINRRKIKIVPQGTVRSAESYRELEVSGKIDMLDVWDLLGLSVLFDKDSVIKKIEGDEGQGLSSDSCTSGLQPVELDDDL